MKWVTTSAFKARCLALLDEAAAGEEIVVTKHGRPLARVDDDALIEPLAHEWNAERRSSSTPTVTRDDRAARFAPQRVRSSGEAPLPQRRRAFYSPQKPWTISPSPSTCGPK